mmetsp:Transcript_96355/g.170347  ORF Transcript_96355/g.170347 Transcript_96355/m.170347 type:complete len:96 (+) Transcript_96355:44-331(+)
MVVLFADSIFKNPKEGEENLLNSLHEVDDTTCKSLHIFTTSAKHPSLFLDIYLRFSITGGNPNAAICKGALAINHQLPSQVNHATSIAVRNSAIL